MNILIIDGVRSPVFSGTLIPPQRPSRLKILTPPNVLVRVHKLSEFPGRRYPPRYRRFLAPPDPLFTDLSPLSTYLYARENKVPKGFLRFTQLHRPLDPPFYTYLSPPSQPISPIFLIPEDPYYPYNA